MRYVEQLTEERDAMKDAKETMLLEHLNEDLDVAERRITELETAIRSAIDMRDRDNSVNRLAALLSTSKREA